MAIQPTNANMYYVDAQFVYTPIDTPVTIAIPFVDDVDEDYKADPKYLSGDDAPGPRVKVNTNEMRTLTIHTSAIAILNSIPRGVQGTFSVKRPDAKNGVAVGGGGLLITMNNCSLHDLKTNGKHGEYAKVQADFSAIWTQDGTGKWTDPVVVTPL